MQVLDYRLDLGRLHPRVRQAFLVLVALSTFLAGTAVVNAPEASAECFEEGAPLPAPSFTDPTIPLHRWYPDGRIELKT